MEISDEPGDSVIHEGASIGSFCESYIKIQLQEPCQDSTCPLSLFLESWRTCRFLMNLEMVVRLKGASIGSFCDSYIKIQLQEPCQDSTCPLSLFLESWRTWRFLMHLVMVSDGRGHHRKDSLKVSWWLDIGNTVKTPPVLLVSSWSLGGHRGSW